MTRARSRDRIAQQMQQAVGEVTKSSMARMEQEMPWFYDLTAEHRAWIGMILQAGYNSFISWFRQPGTPAPALATEVFGSAPRSFAGVITLQQTVAMIRLSIEVADTELTRAVDPQDAEQVRTAISRYGRELAFATADVYAHAAELRGAWDARLESLVVDSIMRGDPDESVRTRASALGWLDADNVAVVVGRAPGPSSPEESLGESAQGLVEQAKSLARRADLTALGAVQGDRLVVVLGGVTDPDKAGALLSPVFGPGPVVVGPVVAGLLEAHASAAAAVSGLRAAAAWPREPGPVTSEDLLAERALSGDDTARRDLVTTVYDPLQRGGSALLETLVAFLDQGGSIEGTARTLFVHPNTVRYRLKRVLDLTGLAASKAPHAFALRLALMYGRLRDSGEGSPPSL